MSVSATSDLAFGKLATGSGGSVTVSPAGSRTKSGDISLLSSGAGEMGRFLISGAPDEAYTISLPTNGEVTLLSGGNSLTVTNFTSTPATSGSLGGSGSQVLNVGATLNVGAAQAPGNYSGTYTITINNP